MNLPDQDETDPLVRLQGVTLDQDMDGRDGIDWALEAGEFWVMGGLNWSGKTDFLSVVAGLRRPAAGRQFFFGREAGDYPRAEQVALRRKIGFVFEDNGRLFTDLNVAQNVALPIGYHSNRRLDELQAETSAILHACQLEAFASRLPDELNRGLKRRVALARALAVEPDVLLVDSPLTSLDPVHIKWWIEFLPRLLVKDSFPFRAPSAIVVTVEDFRHWLGPNRQFGLLQSGQLHCLGDARAVESSGEPQVQEMMTEDTSILRRL